MNLCLDIDNVSTRSAPANALFESWVRAALKPRHTDAEISLRIVDEAEIAELNREYRGQNYATNVLSFPTDLPPELNLPHLGDIIICAAIVEHEAAAQAKTPEAHWAHMTVHGTLHLLGYDHVDDDEADAMEQLEINILSSLNYPNPYDSDADNHV
jgi:probable rRNA maturation factor